MMEACAVRPMVQVRMHSYNRDMADVEFMMLVKGSTNFLANLGSNGVKEPNYTANSLIRNTITIETDESSSYQFDKFD